MIRWLLRSPIPSVCDLLRTHTSQVRPGGGPPNPVSSTAPKSLPGFGIYLPPKPGPKPIRERTTRVSTSICPPNPMAVATGGYRTELGVVIPPSTSTKGLRHFLAGTCPRPSFSAGTCRGHPSLPGLARGHPSLPGLAEAILPCRKRSRARETASSALWDEGSGNGFLRVVG
jgi:hypothetical protein